MLTNPLFKPLSRVCNLKLRKADGNVVKLQALYENFRSCILSGVQLLLYRAGNLSAGDVSCQLRTSCRFLFSKLTSALTPFTELGGRQENNIVYENVRSTFRKGGSRSRKTCFPETTIAFSKKRVLRTLSYTILFLPPQTTAKRLL